MGPDKISSSKASIEKEQNKSLKKSVPTNLEGRDPQQTMEPSGEMNVLVLYV